jgi:hypothetical protein
MKSSKIKSLEEEFILSGLFELEFIWIYMFSLNIFFGFNEGW